MHYKSLLRPFLSEANARKRLRFARRYVHMAEDFWEKWTFSDEVIIARGEGQRPRETLQTECSDTCTADKALTDVL
ncbi:hypothetical protein NW754_014346 [Fusarium falciforme]|nr:hypothetical protein NW754_014346 [Fusarium falciforme]